MIRPSLPRGKGERTCHGDEDFERARAGRTRACGGAGGGRGGKDFGRISFGAAPPPPRRPIQPTALLCERLRDLAQEDRQQEVHATYDEYH